MKVVPFESLGAVSYSPSTVTMAVSWNLGLGLYRSFKVIENGAVRQTMYDFLLVRHCNYSSILYSLWVTWR